VGTAWDQPSKLAELDGTGRLIRIWRTVGLLLPRTDRRPFAQAIQRHSTALPLPSMSNPSRWTRFTCPEYPRSRLSSPPGICSGPLRLGHRHQRSLPVPLRHSPADRDPRPPGDHQSVVRTHADNPSGPRTSRTSRRPVLATNPHPQEYLRWNLPTGGRRSGEPHLGRGKYPRLNEHQ